MTSNRQDSSPETQDSDDLIAELARLVAKDARTTSAQSEAYARAEPSFVPEPSRADEPAARDEESQVQQPEPDHYRVEDYDSDRMEAFDFGFEQAPESPVDESDDPIAGLIADAEVEAYARDVDEEAAWQDDAQDIPYSAYEPEPIPSYAAAPAEQYAPPSPAERDTDPLREIEALIGDVARASTAATTDSAMPGRRVKSIFLEDDATNSAVDAAESAILAAAAATGASVRRVESAPEPAAPASQWAGQEEPPQARNESIPDPLFAAPPQPPYDDRVDAAALDDDEFYAEEEMERPRRSRNLLAGYLIPIAAGAVLVALIGGAYVMFFAGQSEPGEAPVLTADASPVKEEAAPPAQSAAADSVVFNEIEGNSNPVAEELVSRDQTGGVSGSDVASAIAIDEGEIALANRPVRTVTVRPDGTIVPADDSVAGSNVLPVDRPNVPEVPNSTMTSDPIGAAIAEAMAGAGGELSFESPAAPDVGEEGDGVVATGNSAEAADVQPVSVPMPVARPETIAVAAAPESASQPTPSTQAPATSNPAAWVQLSSQRTEEAARAGIPDLERRYGSLFNGAAPEVNRVDLGERGIYYRVRLPQPTLADANAVCGAIQGQGGDCFVLNN
ncbi:SPOR domain-containing protein [Pelagibacterium lacus]|uniref:Uncharacterized protein n=1 Tax=Pelagibacterium lacus TaxID=2282655 RepID=A0A369W7R3_9HYPH|nr:SPOR domain-containing protein [Pelagibacterium lacus]RDE09292.1 hypothetical protein DVH29_07500 [Pelagibacterium lacus]